MTKTNKNTDKKRKICVIRTPWPVWLAKYFSYKEKIFTVIGLKNSTTMSDVR